MKNTKIKLRPEYYVSNALVCSDSVFILTGFDLNNYHRVIEQRSRTIKTRLNI